MENVYYLVLNYEYPGKLPCWVEWVFSVTRVGTLSVSRSLKWTCYIWMFNSMINCTKNNFWEEISHIEEVFYYNKYV